jgi:hypothetical protein
MLPKVQKGGIYKHYKTDKEYAVQQVAKHETTGELMVVYTALAVETESDLISWVRPLSEFTETVEFNGSDVPRFQEVEGVVEL